MERDAANEERNRAKEILSKLKDELVNKAFDLSYTGRVEAVENILNEAKEAGADEAICQTILGMAMMYGDQMEEAVDVLEAAYAKDPNRLATVCAAVWGNLALARYDRAHSLFTKIGEVFANAGGVQTDHDRLMFAQTRVLGAKDISVVVSELDEIVQRHPAWAIARVIRAEAIMQQAVRNLKLETGDLALDDVRAALQISPNNPYVVREALKVVTHIIMLRSP